MIQRKDMRIRKRVSRTLEDELYHLRTVNQRLIGIGDQLMQAQAENTKLIDANQWVKDSFYAKVRECDNLQADKSRLQNALNETAKSLEDQLPAIAAMEIMNNQLKDANAQSARIIDAYLQDGRRQMATIDHLRAEITLMRQTVATWEMNKSIERSAAANVITAGNLVIEKTKNLIKENDRLRAALERYANPDHWRPINVENFAGPFCVFSDWDKGDFNGGCVAARALKGSPE